MSKFRNPRPTNPVVMAVSVSACWACLFFWWWFWWQPCPPPGRVWFPPPWIGHPGVPTDTNSGAPPVIIEWLN